MVDVDLKSVFLCCQAEARVMLPRGYGKIINTASMSAISPTAPAAGQLQRGQGRRAAPDPFLAAEWAPRGVRVNCISPGYTSTPLVDAPAAPTAWPAPSWLRNTPMGRLGEVADLQGAVVYLAAEASDYVTGLDMVMTAGTALW